MRGRPPFLTIALLTHMLVDTKLRSLRPQNKVFRLADANGLCIEVRTAGAKIWRYRYRFGDKANMLIIGEYPLVSLAEAHAEHDRAEHCLKKAVDCHVPTCTAFLSTLDAVMKTGHWILTIFSLEKNAGKNALAGCRGDGSRSRLRILGEKVSARALPSSIR